MEYKEKIVGDFSEYETRRSQSINDYYTFSEIEEHMEKNTSEEDFEMPVELLQPWSSFVLSSFLPPHILKKMIKITDKILEDREAEQKAGNALVGQIENEYFIAPNILKREGLIPFFLDMCKFYLTQAAVQSNPFARELILKEEWFPKLTSMWVVSQKDNEYNPIHKHDDDVSAVMYLKIPEYLPDRKHIGSFQSAQDSSERDSTGEDLVQLNTPITDGSIVFTNNTTRDTLWAKPQMTVQPQVGQFFIFPASQDHLVYPFRTIDGKGERVSVSFNSIFSSTSEKEFKEREKKQQEQNKELK
jgi:hypothetical protein